MGNGAGVLVDPLVPEKGSAEDYPEFPEGSTRMSTAAVPPAPPDQKLEYASSCYLPTSFIPLPLVNKFSVNHDTYIFEFGLPEDKSLNLPVCACLLMCAPDREHKSKGGGDAVRPYTPVSPHDMVGKFQLLVKVYQQWGDPGFAHSYRPAGAVSNYINSLSVGETVLFKHIKFNIKIQYPFTGVKTITMLAVGAGIAPMIQALHKLLNTEGDTTQIVLILGNRTVADILMRPLLTKWSQEHLDRLKVVHVVGSRWSNNVRMSLHAPVVPKGFEELAHPRLVELHTVLKKKLWTCTNEEERRQAELDHWNQHKIEMQPLRPQAELGWVSELTIRKHAFPPAADTRVFVCGLPAWSRSSLESESDIAAGYCGTAIPTSIRTVPSSDRTSSERSFVSTLEPESNDGAGNSSSERTPLH